MTECWDGCEIFIKGKFSNFTKKKWVTKYPADFEMIKKKIDKVWSRHYIDGGTLTSLKSLYSMPKGEDDIRLVHDITALGLNDEFWDPTFWMALIENVLDIATHLSMVWKHICGRDVSYKQDVGKSATICRC